MEHLFTTKEADKHFWELLTDVPKVKKPIALLLAVLNCVIPGAGSVVISFMGDERQLAWSWDKTTFITGVIPRRKALSREAAQCERAEGD